jgi:predicted  nucleic acid-binding Zn-ribbon protein
MKGGEKKMIEKKSEERYLRIVRLEREINELTAEFEKILEKITQIYNNAERLQKVMRQIDNSVYDISSAIDGARELLRDLETQ